MVRPLLPERFSPAVQRPRFGRHGQDLLLAGRRLHEPARHHGRQRRRGTLLVGHEDQRAGDQAPEGVHQPAGQPALQHRPDLRRIDDGQRHQPRPADLRHAAARRQVALDVALDPRAQQPRESAHGAARGQHQTSASPHSGAHQHRLRPAVGHQVQRQPGLREGRPLFEGLQARDVHLQSQNS